MTSGFTATRRRLALLRLAALGVSPRGAGDPAEVVRRLLAVQAQDYESAVWSIGLRTGASRAAVDAAHARGAFVRSWPLRGTLHFVGAEDLHWLLALTAERTLRTAAARHRQLGLTTPVVDRATAAAVEVLGGGRRAGRRELLGAFEAAGVSTAGQRGADLLLILALRGHLVLSGKDSWALLRDVVLDPRAVAPDDALRELALRYFRSHGPATARDLAWWSSLTLTDARRAADLARDDLESTTVDAVEYLMRPGLEPASRGTWLLPGFDEYLLGYADRSAPLAGADARVLVPSRNGQFQPTVVVGGQVVGLWRRAGIATSVRVDIEPFASFPAGASSGVASAARRFGRYLGLPVEVAGG
jgi:hypothetical protein